jgi:DNA polymerase
MKIYTIDFETFYSPQYSLTKMTTEEYVRGDEFEVIGVSVQEDDGEPVWCSGTRKEIKDFLQQHDIASNLVLAHNTMFDAAILSWYFGIVPAGWLDTLSMGRALHGSEVGGSLAALAQHYGVGTKGDEVVNALGKRRADFTPEQLHTYGEYCRNDVAITYALFCAMEAFPPSELRLIDLTVKMFAEPVLLLDADVLEHHKVDLDDAKKALMKAISADQGTLNSNPKFAELLIGWGVKPPMKISLTTGRETYAFAKTDEGLKALLEHESPIIQALVAARLGTKSTLAESRVQRFIGIAQRGAIPVPLRYYAAHTGRWGGDDKINLHNLPRSGELKNAIRAPIGYKIIDSDSSQIEARTLAWLAEQDDLTQAFEDGQDVYKIMASAIYNKLEADISKQERFVGKTTILGCGYGMGAAKFQTQLAAMNVVMDLAEAQRIIDVYRKTYPKIVALWASTQKALKAIGNDQSTTLGRPNVLGVDGRQGILLPNGLRLKYPNLRSHTDPETQETGLVYDTKRGKAVLLTRIYGGKAVENICQALARIIIGEQMLMVARKYRVVMTVHDAITCVVPEKEVDTAREYVEMCMKIRPKWALELPLNCESGYGDSYGEC